MAVYFTAIRQSYAPVSGIQESRVDIDDSCPCLTCSVKIAQLGISEVVYSHGYHMDKDVSDLDGLVGQCADIL